MGSLAAGRKGGAFVDWIVSRKRFPLLDDVPQGAEVVLYCQIYWKLTGATVIGLF